MHAMRDDFERSDGEHPVLFLSIDEAPGLFAEAVLTDEGPRYSGPGVPCPAVAAGSGGIESFRLDPSHRFVQVDNPERLRKDSGRINGGQSP
jgi:hypothetical protein